MISKIHPIQLLETVFKGYSKPQHILFSDGQTYVVKFKNNPSGTRIMVNEYIAGKLGQLLSLPIVPFEVVQIEEEFIKKHSILSNYKFAPGSQFASLYLENCIQLERNSRNEHVTITNREHLARMIVFDLWIGNTDRKENNVLLEPVVPKGYYLHMIDHGRCFSNADWTVKALKQMPKMSVKLNVHKWCASLIQNQNEVQVAIEEIMALSEEKINEVIDSIPNDWEVSDVERKELIMHLLKARELLKDISLVSDSKKKKK